MIRRQTHPWSRLAVGLAAVCGAALVATCATASSATYDEAAYLRIASTWWRGGDIAEITRMGSPLTFFKLQAAPAFFLLDLGGQRTLVDAPVERIAELLPLVRVGGLWLWLVAFATTVLWSRRLYGPRAAVMAAWLFALSPNLVAHGALMTMETPLLAASTLSLYAFWRFLQSSRRRYFLASAAACGAAFSCKFTAVLLPPILAVAWLVDGGRSGLGVRRFARVAIGMTAFVAVMIGADLLVTGGAMIAASPRVGEHPSAPGWLHGLLETNLPSDWVGFATQCRHQASGGPSYLLGERRQTGWWYYYLVAIAVKAPLGVLGLLVARAAYAVTTRGERRDWFLLLVIGLFLLAAMFGSKRNYGLRYLLPIMPLAIVWASRLAECKGIGRLLVGSAMTAQAIAVAWSHPHELSYFNEPAGGTRGGRFILADSNLDWGQGLRSFARLERAYPPMTLYYFGDLDPARYGVHARSIRIDAHADASALPGRLRCPTRFLAVSASLQHGPWGPAGYFEPLKGMKPVATTDDGTIAVYDLAERPELIVPQPQ